MARIKPPALPGPHIVRDKAAALRARMDQLVREGRPAQHADWLRLHIDSVRALVDGISIYVTVSREIAATLRADKRLSNTLSALASELVSATGSLRELIREIEAARTKR